MKVKISLRCESLTAGYDGARVIQDVTFSVEKGGIFGVLGRNGMGKSTLLKSIIGLIKPMAGKVYVSDVKTSDIPPYKVARLGVSYVPQEAAIFQDLTVEENLKLVTHGAAELSECFDIAAEYFPVIPDRRKQLAGTLSGGEQKMLLMTRALATKPSVILVDEISEGLQPSMVSKFAQVVKDFAEKKGAAVILVEQNVGFLGAVAESVALLKLGRLVDVKKVASMSNVESELTEMLWD